MAEGQVLEGASRSEQVWVLNVPSWELVGPAYKTLLWLPGTLHCFLSPSVFCLGE